MRDLISQDDLNALFSELSLENKETPPKEAKGAGSLISQDDLNALLGGLSLETPAKKIDNKSESSALTQDDLNALLGGLSLENKETPPKEARNVECADGSESLTQDQIDELLKMLDS